MTNLENYWRLVWIPNGSGEVWLSTNPNHLFYFILSLQPFHETEHPQFSVLTDLYGQINYPIKTGYLLYMDMAFMDFPSVNLQKNNVILHQLFP